MKSASLPIVSLATEGAEGGVLLLLLSHGISWNHEQFMKFQ